MLIAHDERRQFVVAEELEEYEGQRFFCPQCHEPVFLRRGTKKIRHFAHQKQCTSEYATERETAQHLSGKTKLLQWFALQRYEVSLEPLLIATNQRPDLLVDEQWAVEYQYSQIPPETIAKRTALYVKQQLKPLWIVHPKYMKMDTPFYFTISYFLQEMMHDRQVIMYNPTNDRFIVLHDLWRVSKTKFVGYLTHLEHANFHQLLCQSTGQFATEQWLRLREQMMNQVMRFSSREHRILQRLLYEARLTIEALPLYVGVPLQSDLVCAPLYWQMIAYVVVVYRKEPLSEALYWISQLTKATVEVVEIAVNRYFSALTSFGLLHESEKNCYIVNNPYHFHSDEQLLQKWMEHLFNFKGDFSYGTSVKET